MKFGVLVKHSQQGCDIFFGRFLLLIFSCGALRTPLLKHAGALLSQLHCSGDQCNLSSALPDASPLQLLPWGPMEGLHLPSITVN